MTTEHDDATIVEPHITLPELAALLGVTKHFLINRLSKRDPEILALKPTKVLGRWLFPAAAIRAAFDRGRWKATGSTVELPRIHTLRQGRQQRAEGDPR